MPDQSINNSAPFEEYGDFAVFAARGVKHPARYSLASPDLYVSVRSVAYGLGALVDDRQLIGYLNLVWFAFDNEEAGVLPADPVKLKRIAGCPVTQPMLRGFMRLENGTFYNRDLAMLQENTFRRQRIDRQKKQLRKPSLTRRFSILQRDGHRCVYCGRGSSTAELVVDHVIPISAGGADDASNMVTACFECNAGKSDRLITPVERSEQ